MRLSKATYDSRNWDSSLSERMKPKLGFQPLQQRGEYPFFLDILSWPQLILHELSSVA